MAEYLNVPVKTLISEISLAGFLTFKAINQPPWLNPEPRKTNNISLFSKLKDLERLPNAYYGVGGCLLQYRLFIPIIALYKYRKKILEDAGIGISTIVYDACPYDLVNQIEPKSKKYPDLSDLWNEFTYEVEKRADEISEITAQRKILFESMAKILKAEIRYIPSTSLFRDQDYIRILLQLLEEPEKGWWNLVPVAYRKCEASILYVPMEIAEALALKGKYGVTLKIGDPKERPFDIEISKRDSTFLFAYTPSAITANGERPPYRNDDDIEFTMTNEDVRAFLEKQPSQVRDQFKSILKELGRDSEDFIEETILLVSEIRGRLDAKK